MSSSFNPVQIYKLPIKGTVTEDALRDWVAVTEYVSGSTARQTVRRPYPQGDGDISDGSGVLAGAIIVSEDGTISLRIDTTKLAVSKDGYLTLSSDIATYYDGDGIKLKPRLITRQKRDEDGNVILDEDGNPVMEEVEVDEQRTINVAPGNGIRIVDGKVAVKPDETKGISVSEDGIEAKVSDGLKFDDSGNIAVKDSKGIVADDEGVAVAIDDEGGLAFDDDGNLGVNFTNETVSPADGTVWSAKQAKEYSDSKTSTGAAFSGECSWSVAGGTEETLKFNQLHAFNCELADRGTTVNVGSTTYCHSAAVSMMFEFEFKEYSTNSVILEVSVNETKYYVDSTVPKATLAINTMVTPDTEAGMMPVSVKFYAADEDEFPDTYCTCHLSISAN